MEASLDPRQCLDDFLVDYAFLEQIFRDPRLKDKVHWFVFTLHSEICFAVLFETPHS